MAKRYERIEKGLVRQNRDGVFYADFRPEIKGKKASQIPVKYVKITDAAGRPVNGIREARKFRSICVNKRTEEITVAAKFEGRPLRISDLRNLAVDYQEEHKKATSTLNNMRGSFRRILGFEGDRNAKPLPALLDDLKLVDIRRQHIIDLRKALGKAFSPNTVRGTLGMFKLAWEILHLSLIHI